jgi:cell wall assembly regulator SMI1
VDAVKAKMQATIAKLVAAVKAQAKDAGLDHVTLRPYPPAPENVIAAFERHFEIKIPPTYRAFLELHNGYDYLAYPGHMLSVEKIMPGGEWYKLIQTWKGLSADYGNGEVLNGIVIANLDSPNKWVYLDPTKPGKQGEFTVVHYLPDESTEYPDLIAFFEDRIRYCNLRVDFSAPWEYKDPQFKRKGTAPS